MHHNFNQLGALFIGFSIMQSFNGAAHRSERIFQFMSNICGKSFNSGDPVIERLRHVAQRAGELADLITARSEVRNFNAAVIDATAHPVCGS